MYNNGPISAACEPVNVRSSTESLQGIAGDILNQTRIIQGLTHSVEGGLLGSSPSEGCSGERPINCMIDALREIRGNLGLAIKTLENVNTNL